MFDQGISPKLRLILDKHFKWVNLFELENDESQVRLLYVIYIYLPAVYTDYFDNVSHRYGPTSNQSSACLHKLDEILLNMMEWLQDANR